MKKGQASMEMLITVGLFFVFTLPLVFLFFSYSNLHLSQAEEQNAKAVVRKIGENINYVFAFCPSSTYLLLRIPPGMERLIINDKEVVMVVRGKEFSYPLNLQGKGYVAINYGKGFESERKGNIALFISCDEREAGLGFYSLEVREVG